MRIAIPVVSGEVFSPLANAEAFHFYEDDHGKIVREFLEPMEESGTDAAVGLLERYGIDALLCGRSTTPSAPLSAWRASCSSPAIPARQTTPRCAF